jgi:hypothetical protein
MNAELERVYDETPQPAPLSRLEPYKELILRWRRDGHSFPAICKLLGKQGVQITKEPLRQYVRRRIRHVCKGKPVEAVPQQLSGTTDHAAARERIRNLKARPAPSAAQKMFEYTEEDAINPMVLLNPKKREK